MVLDNLSFDIRKGERVALLGNNGCGKTTLSRHIAGVYGKNSKIKVNGEIRGVFETEVTILPELSGRENLEILAQLFYPDRKKQEKVEIINEAIAFSELGNFSNVPFKFYSKGMKARLLLAMVSARPTDLLILDEIFNGTDYFFNEKISKRVMETIFNSSATIFVSHSPEIIKEVCNRILVIHNRKIVFDGRPDEGIEYYHQNCAQTAIQNG